MKLRNKDGGTVEEDHAETANALLAELTSIKDFEFFKKERTLELVKKLREFHISVKSFEISKISGIGY